MQEAQVQEEHGQLEVGAIVNICLMMERKKKKGRIDGEIQWFIYLCVLFATRPALFLQRTVYKHISVNDIET